MNRDQPTIPELVAYALFDLDPRVSEAKRPLHSFLVSLALFEAGNPQSASELRARVAHLLPVDSSLTDEDVEAACALNLEVGLIEQDEDGKLRLSHGRTEQLQQARDRLELRKAAFHSQMLAAVQAKAANLQEDEAARLYEELEARLQEMLHAQSSTVAAAWSPEGDGFDSGIETLDASQHLKDVASAVAPGGAQPSKLRRTVIALGLEEGFRNLDTQAASYLAAVYQRTVAFALLEQDPTVRRVKSSLAAQRVVYLDANVIIAAMFGSDAEHAVAVQVLEVTRTLGAELRVTRFTVSELENRIAEASRWMRRYRSRNELLGIVDDVVIRSFNAARRASPGLRWGAFIGGFEPASAWLAENSIQIDDEASCDETEADELIDAVRSAIEQRRRVASPNVVLTDALNLVHVVRARDSAPADEMGNRVWLVTLDRSLARVERALVDDAIFDGGVSRMAQVWVDLLSPCLPPDEIRLSAYVAHLVQSQFGLLAEDPIFVEKGFLLTVTESRFGVADVLNGTPDRARQILTRLQADEEVLQLVTDPKPEDEAWNGRLHEAVSRALEKLEPAPEHVAAMEEHVTARVEAEHRAEEERRSRILALRELAETKETAEAASRELSALRQEQESTAAELTAERNRPWWSKLFARSR